MTSLINLSGRFSRALCIQEGEVRYDSTCTLEYRIIVLGKVSPYLVPISAAFHDFLNTYLPKSLELSRILSCR